ncbi:MAG: N-formylglutamate amidohydrolase [Christensenellales bacterium]|jgi:N-formylglutamate deformylase
MSMDAILKGIFYRLDPTFSPVPVVYDVSRSGRTYPVDYRSPIPFTVAHDNVSSYLEEFYCAAPEYGATMLYALFPNTYIDANRSELDIDPSIIDGEWPVPLQLTSTTGLGLLKVKSRYGEPFQEGKLSVADVMARLDNYYRPYHAELKDIISRMKKAWGFVYQISCHCMSAVGAPTHPDPGQDRADFCIGNLNGQTASPDFMEFLKSIIKGMGYSVTVNQPYAGGELNRRYGNPSAGVESVMLEINKKLFIDIKTFKKTSNFNTMRNDLKRLMQEISNHARNRIRRNAL